MQEQSIKSNTRFIAIIAVFSWFAVLLQLYLIIINRVASFPETVVRFFSFFTIQSNILVGLMFCFYLVETKIQMGIVFFQS